MKRILCFALVAVFVLAFSIAAGAASKTSETIEARLNILPYADIVVGSTELDIGDISVVGAKYQDETTLTVRTNTNATLTFHSRGWSGELSPLNTGLGWDLYLNGANRLSVKGTQTRSTTFQRGAHEGTLIVHFHSHSGENWNWWQVEQGSYTDVLTITVSAAS